MIDELEAIDFPQPPYFRREIEKEPPVFHHLLYRLWVVEERPKMRLCSDRSDPADYYSERNHPNGSQGYWENRFELHTQKQLNCTLEGLKELGMALGSSQAGDLSGVYDHIASATGALTEGLLDRFLEMHENLERVSDWAKERWK